MGGLSAPVVPSLRDDLLASLGEDWQRTLVSDLEIAAKARTTEWLEPWERVYAGSGSLTIQDSHEKLLSWRTWPATSGELARRYLNQVWESGTARPLMARPTNLGFKAQAPLYCEPTLPEEHRVLAYVDVVSCYWQLLSCWRPDDMPLGRGLSEGRLSWLRPVELGRERHLRHAVAGAMWSSQIEWCHHGKWVRAAATSRWSNPYLKRRVMETLHAIALEVASKWTLFGWLTDAAIVEAHQADEVVAYLRDSWHLESRIVAIGIGAVWNVTSYRVGEKTSLGIQHQRIPTPSAFSNLVPPEVGTTWLASERRSRSDLWTTP